MGLEDHGLRDAARCVGEAVSVVALTGAGISADSGIATFRESGGMWDRFDLDEVMRVGGLLAYLISRPWEAVDFLSELRDSFASAGPNPGHLALAELERAGHVSAVVTQNVDGLHQEAGSRKVVELHGTFSRRRCTGCGRVEAVSRDDLVATLGEMVDKLASFMVSDPAHVLRRCECGGLWRADVVEFGEQVHDLDLAVDAVRGADVLLVCGTSCEVYPAAGLPEEARSKGAVVVEVNPEPTTLRPDIAIRRSASEALADLVETVREASKV